jgi:hypothetical protein
MHDGVRQPERSLEFLTCNAPYPAIAEKGDDSGTLTGFDRRCGKVVCRKDQKESVVGIGGW